jgi:hypothetical protein
VTSRDVVKTVRVQSFCLIYYWLDSAEFIVAKWGPGDSIEHNAELNMAERNAREMQGWMHNRVAVTRYEGTDPGIEVSGSGVGCVTPRS